MPFEQGTQGFKGAFRDAGRTEKQSGEGGGKGLRGCWGDPPGPPGLAKAGLNEARKTPNTRKQTPHTNNNNPRLN